MAIIRYYTPTKTNFTTFNLLDFLDEKSSHLRLSFGERSRISRTEIIHKPLAIIQAT